MAKKKQKVEAGEFTRADLYEAHNEGLNDQEIADKFGIKDAATAKRLRKKSWD